MAGLGLNIVMSRLSQPGSQFSDRLDELSDHVRGALADLEEMARAAAREAGVAERDLEEHVGTAVGVVVGNRCRGAVSAAASLRSARRFPETETADT